MKSALKPMNKHTGKVTANPVASVGLKAQGPSNK